MKMLKKTISFILAATMLIAVCSVMPTSISAARNRVLIDDDIEHGRIDVHDSPNI